MMVLNTPAPSLPIGVILPYVGLVADIPTGWALCDGQNGTVDMRNKFVMGGEHAQIGNQGGANEVTPSGSVSVANHTLSTSQMPSHRHLGGHLSTIDLGIFGNITQGSGTIWQVDRTSSSSGRKAPYTNYDGSGSAHNHGGSFSGNQQDNKPAYYQTAYIQRVA